MKYSPLDFGGLRTVDSALPSPRPFSKVVALKASQSDNGMATNISASSCLAHLGEMKPCQLILQSVTAGASTARVDGPYLER